MTTLQDICNALNTPLPQQIDRPASFLKNDICADRPPGGAQLYNLYNHTELELENYRAYHNHLTFQKGAIIITIGSLLISATSALMKKPNAATISLGVSVFSGLITVMYGVTNHFLTPKNMDKYDNNDEAYANLKQLKNTLTDYLDIKQ